MSHHLDSPIARQDVRLDITDLYLFRGEVGTVFVINVCHSIAGAVPSPGFHPEGMYEFKVDLNGDAVEEITYRIKFDARDADGAQRLTLHRIDGAQATDPHAPGTLLLKGATGEKSSSSAGLRIWAGRAGDPFWIEPDVLHAVGHALQDGTTVDLKGWDPSRAKNLFAGHSVYSLVLEIPDQELVGSGKSDRKSASGPWLRWPPTPAGWRSINRVGHPMIHPLFTQYNEDLGNRSERRKARGRFRDLRRSRHQVDRRRGESCRHRGRSGKLCGEGCASVLSEHVALHGGDTKRCSVSATGTAARLTDNAPDVMFSIATNSPVRLGIGKELVTSRPSKSFPYVPAVPASVPEAVTVPGPS